MTDTAPGRFNQFATTVVLGVVVGAGVLQLLPREPATDGLVSPAAVADATVAVSTPPTTSAPIISQVPPSVSNVLESYGVAEVVTTDSFRSALPDSVLQVLADHDAVLRVPTDSSAAEEGGQ